jgi:hypothetical protein
MKVLRHFIFLLLVVGVASSCYKKQDFWEDNVTVTDKAVPFIYMYALDSANLGAGSKVRVLLEFYCKDPLKEIRLYQGGATIAANRTLVSTEAYKPAYSQIRQMDTLVLSYTAPASNVSGATVFLHAEAVSNKDVTKGTWQVTATSRSFKAR